MIEEKSTVLVTGATGQTGSRVAAGLRAAGVRIRAVSRSGSVPFDWHDERTWNAALSGVSAAYLVTPMEPDFDAAAVAGLVERATASGVRRLVLLSGLSAGYGSAPMLSREIPVRESGVEWTILRPGAFQQNLLAGAYLHAMQAGELRLPLAPEVRSAYIDVADIADIAVTVLTTEGHSGRVYNLSGPRALSNPDVLDILSRVTGRPIRYIEEPEGEWVARMRSAGVSTEQLNWSLETFAALRRGDYATVYGEVRELLGREPREFSEATRR
ncbi:NmrA family NAD(P)-binding protein [Nocardia sp. NPDC050406]|uniref:NmrA family NAD(P)-binding protein n=1 Tax=Nocardia sp. NPDC050406 TaxID=3364318 RepID=UPI0037BADEB9